MYEETRSVGSFLNSWKRCVVGIGNPWAFYRFIINILADFFCSELLEFRRGVPSMVHIF